MLAVLSPSKTLDFDRPPRTKIHTTPDLLKDSEVLVSKLKRLSAKKLTALMGISDKLATENQTRYQQWNVPFTPANSKPAILAFRGDVYEGLQAETFSAKDFRFAQRHLRVLSGLYGILRPLDLIQPYRLEMGTKLTNRRGKNLYAFWDERITKLINEAMLGHQGDKVLLNLASNEYFKSIKTEKLTARVVGTNFKEKKGNKYQMITFFAKKARGTLAAFIVKNQITKLAELKNFQEDGYRYNKSLSTDDQWVFTRGK